ncbi:MAG: hypothetical protein IKB33_04365 [Spirochaetaceae bacterium]|nr:hypothetical protein [Spirochaetaceae bacterium]
MKKLVCYWLVMGMVGVVIAQHRGRDNPDFLSSEFNPKYTASSIMMEEIAGGVRIYAAQNLGRYLYSVAGDATQLVWNQEHLPWMEGAAGNGVGQTIKLSCDKSFSSLSILNGYVDLANPAAFRENSRAKSIRIEDLDNGLVYQLNLSDEIAFTGIQLKLPTCNVLLLITEVYEGSVYQDACISAIIPEDSPSTFYFQGQGDGRAVGVGRRF